MSTYSEAWHNTPPAIRDFYRNFADLNTIFCGRDLANPDWPLYGYFTTLGWAFLCYRGPDIAAHNWTAQLFDHGSFDPATVVMQLQEMWEDGYIGPAFSAGGLFDWGAQFRDVPLYAENYPKPKYKIRKSYWTGAPRRRRNL